MIRRSERERLLCNTQICNDVTHKYLQKLSDQLSKDLVRMEFLSIKPDRPSKCTWKPNGTNNPHHTSYSKQSDPKKTLTNILEAIGQTPMVKLNNIPKKYGIKCEILAKCEFMNPGGSLKDRISIRMVEKAERDGLLKPGYTIIEPTSGNTGVGVAMVAAVKGYNCIVVMSEKYSDEKLYSMQALGAKVVRTPLNASFDGSDSVFAVSERLHKEIPNSVILAQFANPENPLVHYNETASEIWEQCDGKVDYIVGGFGTGGTLTGVGRKFKEISPSTKIVVADPKKSLHHKCLDPDDQMHSVEGIGYHFVPTVTDLSVADITVKTDERESFQMARELIEEEGLLSGGSSGAALCAALKIAEDLPADKRIVILLPDTVRNYLTKFVSDWWMEIKGFTDPPKPLQCNEWWWNLPVSKILLRNPVILPIDCTCEKAVKILQENSIQEAPLYDDKTGIKGLINLNKLLSSLISGEVKHSDLASKVLVKQFKKVATTMTLGRLSRIIQHTLYAVVFDEDKNDALIGILTQNGLFNFIFHVDGTNK